MDKREFLQWLGFNRAEDKIVTDILKMIEVLEKDKNAERISDGAGLS